MKKLIIAFIVAMSVSLAGPMQTYASKVENKTFSMADKKANEIKEAASLTQRLDEINAVDKTNLRWNEKREMRKEVRAINKRLKQVQGGVYLSGGAIIIIVILLIVLL